MSDKEVHFLSVMENLATSLKHLSLLGSHHNSLGSCCVAPSSHGRSLGHGGWSGGSTTGGAGSSIGQAKVGKARVKGMGKGKEKAVEELEEESVLGLEVEDDEGTSGGEGANLVP